MSIRMIITTAKAMGKVGGRNLIWQIYGSPNLPAFPPTKVSFHTIYFYLFIFKYARYAHDMYAHYFILRLFDTTYVAKDMSFLWN